MPELPEVETICRELAPLVAGRRITGFELFWERTLRGIEPRDFQHHITGRHVSSLSRRGKYLVFAMEDGFSFSVHFKMTGSLVSGITGGQMPSYTRAVFRLDNSTSLYFTDPRKFGRIEALNSSLHPITRLGPEPLESGFTVECLAGVLAGRRAPVKSVLLEQKLVAGIGNMYADEALYLARIHPLRPAESLKPSETAALHSAIREVLLAAIERKGATVSNYTRPGGEAGRAQEGFKVAHRRGAGCPCCNTPLERITVRQRGTYLCPRCQKYA